MPALPGIAKLVGGSVLKTGHDWVVKPWGWVAEKGIKHIAPQAGGAKFDQATGKLLSYNPVEGHWFRNTIGGAYNRINSTGRRIDALERSGRRDLNKITPGLGNTVGTGLRIASGAGLAGPLIEAGMEAGGLTDNPFYSAVKGINTINYPYTWLYGSEHSPLNWAFENLSPFGIAMKHGGRLVENTLRNSATAGAQQAINSTADALSNMSFGDRLGMLISPQQAAATYKSRAFDELARAMANTNASVDGSSRDKAVADIYNTIG